MVSRDVFLLPCPFLLQHCSYRTSIPLCPSWMPQIVPMLCYQTGYDSHAKTMHSKQGMPLLRSRQRVLKQHSTLDPQKNTPKDHCLSISLHAEDTVRILYRARRCRRLSSQRMANLYDIKMRMSRISSLAMKASTVGCTMLRSLRGPFQE